MASQLNPLSSLSAPLAPTQPLSIPSGGAGPASLHPRVLLIVDGEQVPKALKDGLESVIQGCVRKNLKWTETPFEELGAGGSGGQVGENRGPRESEEDETDEEEGGDMDTQWSGDEQSDWDIVWRIRFHNDIAQRQLEITCTHPDFAYVPPKEQFYVDIHYGRKIEAFRALGHVFAVTRSLVDIRNVDVMTGERRWKTDIQQLLNREETCHFESNGVMIDCSRNGVPLQKTLEMIILQMALMGSNILQLYTEDTYKIDEEPFFGYFRGPYTQEELKAIDDYAFNLGIEVIPCIQTLGHLGQILQWSAYGQIRDTADVMLPQYEATYTLIEKMIRTITTPLRSKRIHVGMDESYGMGSGRYRHLFGYKDSIQIFVEHLTRVKKICDDIGVHAMIWSDMLFCFAAKNLSLAAYYDSNNPTTDQMTASLPDDIDYVYWDYYHTLPQGYANKIKHHWELSGKAPWVATGIWTWSRFWTGLPFSFSTMKACLNACKLGSGVRHVMATIWGDEGNEYDVWSALPGILYFSEQCYTMDEEIEAGILKAKFDGISGGDWADYLYACKLDDLRPEDQPIGPGTTSTPNLGKWLLWEEPFFGIFTRQYESYDLESHYKSLAQYLEDCLSSNVSSMNPDHSIPKAIDDLPANRRLRGPFLLAKVLALKSHLRQHLYYYYQRRDTVEIAALAGLSPESRLSRLIVAVDELWRYHRDMWMSTYKPFGWEILEIRYGTLKSRLDTMRWRVSKFLDSNDMTVTSLPELEVENEDLGNGQGVTVVLEWHRVSRATAY